jgi:hypothetical protein
MLRRILTFLWTLRLRRQSRARRGYVDLRTRG